jgi:hypothetical protein
MARTYRNFRGTTTVQLQAWHDALNAYLTSDTMEAGIKSYAIGTRMVSKMSLGEIMDAISDISEELAYRLVEDNSIALAEIGQIG